MSFYRMKTGLIILVATTAAVAQARTELVAYWDFDREDRYADRSGNGADGSAGDNVTTDSDGPLGDAVGIGVSGTTPGNVVTISQADAPAFGVGDFSPSVSG